MAISKELREKLEKHVTDNAKRTPPLGDKALAEQIVENDPAFAEIDLAGYHIVTIRKRLGLVGSPRGGKRAKSAGKIVCKADTRTAIAPDDGCTLAGLEVKLTEVLDYVRRLRGSLRAKVEQVFLSSAGPEASTEQ